MAGGGGLGNRLCTGGCLEVCGDDVNWMTSVEDTSGNFRDFIRVCLMNIFDQRWDAHFELRESFLQGLKHNSIISSN